MFPEAFPLPQEQGGTTPPGLCFPLFRDAPAAGRCEYHTAISAAFQLELATGQPRVDSAGRKVQTFLDSRQPREECPVVSEYSGTHDLNCRFCEPVGGGNPTCSISSQWQHLWSCPPSPARKPHS